MCPTSGIQCESPANPVKSEELRCGLERLMARLKASKCEMIIMLVCTEKDPSLPDGEIP